jgi:hypothetical protein
MLQLRFRKCCPVLDILNITAAAIQFEVREIIYFLVVLETVKFTVPCNAAGKICTALVGV